MQDRIVDRRHSIATLAVLTAIVLAAALPWALKLGADNDLWWHVRTGQLILDHGALPETDPFSFTTNESVWIDHEWLADVVLAVLHQLGGDVALSLFRIVLMLAVIGGLAVALWRRCPQPIALLAALLLIAPIVRVFVTLRPQGWTYLFTIVLLLMLDATSRRPGLVWLAPPLLGLWANLHGGFVFGWALLGVGLGFRALGLEQAGPAADRRTWVRYGIVLALAGLAPALNPYGFALFAYLVRELGADHSLILEWQSIWSFPEYRVAFIALALAPLAAVAAARRFAPGLATAWALYALSLYATWRHGRFLVLLAIFSTLATFAALPAVLERLERGRAFELLARLRQPRWALAICALPLLTGMLQFAVDWRQKGLRLGIDPRRVPVLACEFLKRYDLGPNLLLRLDWGGYAIWHLHPRYRVSADGRNLTVYDERFVDGQLRAYGRGEFAQYFREFDVDTILVEAGGPTFDALERDPRWSRIYGDALAAVFVPREVARDLATREVDSPTVQRESEHFFFP